MAPSRGLKRLERIPVVFSLDLQPTHRAAIRRHAALAYPEECCGVLVGTMSAVRARVVHLLETANVAPRRRRRYAIDPESLLFAHRQAREAGQEVVGYYHSHPDASASPSARDLEEAWPGVCYLIVEVVAGAAVALRGWRLPGQGKRFEEIALSGTLEAAAT